MKTLLPLVGWINNDLQGRIPEKICLLTVFSPVSQVWTTHFHRIPPGLRISLPANYLQMPVLPALQQCCHTRNSERFEISCPWSELSKSLNAGILSAFQTLFLFIFFSLRGIFPLLLVPRQGPKLPCNKPCTYSVSP